MTRWDELVLVLVPADAVGAGARAAVGSAAVSTGRCLLPVYQLVLGSAVVDNDV